MIFRRGFELYLKGPGYSILKLKMSGNRSPVILDVSSIKLPKVPNSRALNYYVVTSGLIPKLRTSLGLNAILQRSARYAVFLLLTG
jgi:hypothetical protein